MAGEGIDPDRGQITMHLREKVLNNKRNGENFCDVFSILTALIFVTTRPNKQA